jgi:hypothetical protein
MHRVFAAFMNKTIYICECYQTMKNNKRDTHQNETKRIEANPYLAKKLKQGRKDMQDGKGAKISIQDLWK